MEFVLTLIRLRRKLGIEPQFIALSAVIGDSNGFERWMGGRLLRRTQRPVPLREGLLLFDGSFRHIDPEGCEQTTTPLITRDFGKGSANLIKPLVRRLVGEGKQVIVFRETKGEARGCAKYLADFLKLPPASDALAALPSGDPSSASRDLRSVLEQGVAFHNADLEAEERHVIESHFRGAGTAIRVICATTTLAMGINTPAEAVVIEGLEHPGDPPSPYTVAEYKNMVGRAGRLGFAAEGTSYLIAFEAAHEHYYWNHYVLGTPESVVSRFLDDDTDSRSLILRVLATTRHLGAPGMSTDDVVGFLEEEFGTFQQRQASNAWKWDRQTIGEALADLKANELVSVAADGTYRPTARSIRRRKRSSGGIGNSPGTGNAGLPATPSPTLP